MKKPGKNLILLAACAVGLVISGCADSGRGTAVGQRDSLNHSETGVSGVGGVGGTGTGVGGVGGGGGR